jgi:hypothetical protein
MTIIIRGCVANPFRIYRYKTKVTNIAVPFSKIRCSINIFSYNTLEFFLNANFLYFFREISLKENDFSTNIMCFCFVLVWKTIIFATRKFYVYFFCEIL